MRTSKVLIISCALVFLASSAHAANAIVGVITGVNEDSVQVSTRSGTVESVRLDVKTGFMKWITQRPWQQDNRADRTALRVGRCVAIDMRRDDSRVAKLIRISTEEPGTIGYPCRH